MGKYICGAECSYVLMVVTRVCVSTQLINCIADKNIVLVNYNLDFIVFGS